MDRPKPESEPDSASVSLRSDSSKEWAPDFKRSLNVPSSHSDSVSLRSDRSKYENPNFKDVSPSDEREKLSPDGTSKERPQLDVVFAVKALEMDIPDSTVSSPHPEDEDASEMSSCHSDGEGYKPPQGGPDSSSSCSIVSKCSSKSCESEPKPTQSNSQPSKTYSKKDRRKNNTETVELRVKTCQKNNGKRVWNKPHYCVYCKKMNKKMARHLQLRHMEEADVAHAFSFPLGSKERKKRLESLKNKGDWRHNQEVLKEGKGEIVTWKQPSHDIRVHCNYYRQTDQTFQVAKVGKLLFAMEGGAKALKGNNLQTLDSAVYAQTEIQSRREEEHHSVSEHSDREDHEEESPLDQASEIKPHRKRPMNRDTDEFDGADGDGEESPLDQASKIKPHRKTPKNKGTKERQKDAPKQAKRPWSAKEKSAVERRMGTFVALRLVPGKEACMLCITQESPALKNRTWKDVKYYVYNEINTVKRRLFQNV